jgi:(2Fe-2S) ferredoxin
VVIGRPPYEILILVCTNLRTDGRESCGARDSSFLYQELKRRVKEAKLTPRVRVSQSGCLDLCAFGPNVIVYPRGTLYSGVAPGDIDLILAETFGADLFPPPERLA